MWGIAGEARINSEVTFSDEVQRIGYQCLLTSKCIYQSLEDTVYGLEDQPSAMYVMYMIGMDGKKIRQLRVVSMT